MKLDYIENVNEFDEYIVRLYDFNQSEAIQFKNLISEIVIKNQQKLNLKDVAFIERRNCNLVLGLFETDEGIFSQDNETFFCALTLATYQNMIILLEPFCIKEKNNYQYLYDLDNPINLLFAPKGTW